MKIQTTSNLFGKAIYTVMVVLVCTSAQAQNLFVSCGVGSLEYPVTTGSVIFEFTPGGAQISFASGFFASGLNAPEGLAFNSAGDLFEADFGSGNINEFKPDGEQSTFASGLNHPTALAFNSAGNLFEADAYSSNIYEFTPDGERSTFASGVSSSGLAFNSAGDLFVTDNGSGNIYKFTPSGVRSAFASGVGYPLGLAFDSAGNLFVADLYGNIFKVTPGGVQSTFASGLAGPWGLAFNSAGDLFEVDYGSGNINEFTPGGVQSTFASGLVAPFAVAFQPEPELQAVGTNGVFQLAVSMPSPYYSTIIQASTDLVNWVNIYTNTPPFTFTDSMATNSPCRFYRALLGP